ncbi:MAG: serine protease [Gemmataceae bacterium]|nr:serine protease [Gemmata sp.]MDW8197737.1 serine protease [Gemmataceae bacterium]
MPWLIGLGVVGFVVLAMSVAIYFVIQSTWSRQSARSLVASTPLSGEELYPRLVRGTVLIASPQGMGSGFIVDSVNRLVITNYHVVGRQKRVTVVFPIYDSAGTLITDLKSYESHIQNTALRGNVLAVDPKRDLCLIQVEQLPTRAVSVPLAEHPAKPGAVVYSVGGSGAGDNLLWRLTKGTVRGRVQRQQFADFGSIDCMILETDAPVNPGDSGGPVVNDRCELVAVVSHHRLGNRLVSGNIDVEEVRHFLRTHSSRR